MSSDLLDVVRHYQRNIERHAEDTERLMHCITKLYNLPIKFDHLQETGIGKTVNALRKYDSPVGVAAKALIVKWKAMVSAAEAEPAATHNSHNSNSHDDHSSHSNGRRSSDEDQENKGSNASSSSDEQPPAKHEEPAPVKENNSSSKSSSSSNNNNPQQQLHNHHSSSRSSSSSRNNHQSKSSRSSDGSEKKHKSSKHSKSKHKESSSSSSSSRNDKDKEKEKEKEKERDKDVSSSRSSNHHSTSQHRRDPITSSSKSETHKSERSSTHERSKSHKSHNKEKEKQKSSPSPSLNNVSTSSTSSSSKSSSSKRPRSSEFVVPESPKPKVAKASPIEDEETDEFDSTMGANFDDVLGMLNMPMSSKKTNKVKSSQKSSSTSSSSSAAAAVTPSSSSKRRDKSPTPTASSSSKQNMTKKPELLHSRAKLEPLDPSIALELPTISNNYKPMPLNQAVMDVVFNHGNDSAISSQKSSARVFNESEALAQGISSKTMRTKIYSGVKTGQIHQVPSLFDLCTRILQKNIDALEYTGGVPFEVLRSVLERATPQQLLNFEDYNQYLIDDTDALWQIHVQRHYRGQQRKGRETWRDMYLRCQDEKDHKLNVLARNIKASQKISEAPVRKTQLAFVDSMVKPPRNVQRKQEIYGTNRKLIATPAARVAALSSLTPNAAKVGDARLRVLAATRDTAQVGAAPVRMKKAPLMAKTLQFMRGRNKR